MSEINKKQLWLVKVEPSEFSFDRLEREKETAWDGVHNYQAQKYLKEMELNDLVFYYHTEKEKAIVGIAKITKEYYIKDEPKFGVVNVGYERHLKNPVDLKTMKANEELQDMKILKQSRLSVSPITEKQWDVILALSESEK